MAGKRILTARVTINMIAADDVFTAENQLLIPEGTVLTEEIIEALQEHSIFALRVKVDEADGKTPILWDASAGDSEQAEKPAEDIQVEFAPPEPSFQPQVEEKNYYQSVRESEEFKEFNETFVQTVDHMKDAFNKAVMQNKEVDSETLLTEVQNVVSKSRNRLHILDMLQCMKGFDDVTFVHSLNVALLSNMIGSIALPDISEEDLEVLTMAGLLADIGKMMVPDDVLQKNGKLTISEFNLMKTHVLHGNNILKNMNLDPRIAEVAMRHHERCDGSGYPGAFRSKDISPFAKIVAIADTYDAMTSDRVYRKAICPFEVIHMFEREGLVKYEVEYLLPFLSTAVHAYVNTQVCLTNGEVGRVVMINPESLSRPIVKVGDNYRDLSKERQITIDRMID